MALKTLQKNKVRFFFVLNDCLAKWQNKYLATYLMRVSKY